ncbi:hypothetical protein DB346_04355 [Verrucomicrobia bacterium LW23]|nr:hypothetical protein DB346_04355 [Verrucomicrobia bacterium LW23]
MRQTSLWNFLHPVVDLAASPPRFSKAQWHRRAALLALLTFPAVAVPVPGVRANPSGGTVTTGSATINGGPGNVTIHQSSDKAIVRWQDFSIQKGETTTFVQPGSGSATLNRVTGPGASLLNGNLNANGRIFLINPNGVVVGKSGRVNTAGFTASTHDVTDSEFLNGGNMTFRGNSTASVINEGTIRATEGDVTLIARQVENHGKLRAPKGSVNLAGATEVLVKPTGTQRVFIKSGTGSVSNSGSIKAAAAELRAAGGNEYALAVNNSGIIRATGVDKSGGRIVLRASSGTVRNSGKLIAAAKAPGKKGGRIDVTGETVHLTSTSLVDVSSPGGPGGEVNLGGGFQGKDATVSNANVTVVDQGAVIDAGGGTKGGQVVVWSEQATGFYGEIDAQGGTGGFAEISSRNYLDYRGSVNTGGGTLLFDPSNITIASAASVDIVSSATPLGTAITTNPASATGNSILDITALLSALALNNVIVHTSSSVNAGGSLFATDTASGDINVQVPIMWTSGRSLTLLAHDDVWVNGSIQATNGGNVNIVAGWNTASLDIATILSNPNNYGFNGNLQNSGGAVPNNGGNVYVGTAPSANVRIGTAGGVVTVAGFDIVVGSAAPMVLSTIGSHLNSAGIYVIAKNDVRLTSAPDGYGLAQIGDGGPLVNTAPITVIAGRDIILNSTVSGNSATRIGNGAPYSLEPTLDIGGDINVSAGRDILFIGGIDSIGHGGPAIDRQSISGDITVVAGRDIVKQGFPSGNHSSIGHDSSETPVTSGNIQVRAGRNITLQPTDGEFFQIGHFAKNLDSITGNIDVIAGGSLTLGGGLNGMVAIGHAGGVALTSPSPTLGGNISVVTSGNINMAVLGANFSKIGHAGGEFSGSAPFIGSGGISVIAGGALTMSAGDSNLPFPFPTATNAQVQIGHGGIHMGFSSVTGNIAVSADSILMTSGLSSLLSYVNIGHHATGIPILAPESIVGNILINYNSSMSLIAGSLLVSPVQVGHYARGTSILSTIASDITVAGNGPLLIQATGVYSPAYVGHGSLGISGGVPTISGNINVTASSVRITEQAINDPTLISLFESLLLTFPIPPELGITAGPIQLATFAKIGHVATGANLVPTSISGDITVNFRDSLSVEGGNGGYGLAFGQIGHGTLIILGAGYDISGDIRLVGGTNSTVNIAGGNDQSFRYGGGNFAIVGHANIGLTFGAEVFESPLLEPLFTPLLASIGYTGPRWVPPTITGDISITAGSLSIKGGNGLVSFAQIGHFTPYTDLQFLQPLLDSLIASLPTPPPFAITIPRPTAPATHGNILIALSGNLDMVGGPGDGSYAMIGHGSFWPSYAQPYLYAAGDRSGHIDIRVGGESSLVDGAGDNAVWWIGHVTAPGFKVTDADILFVTHTLDNSITSTSNISVLDPRFSRSIANLAYGNMTFVSTNSEGAVLQDTGGVLDVASPFTLAILSSGDLTVEAPIANSGGSLFLVAGFDSDNLFGVGFGATGQPLVDTALFRLPSEASADLTISNSITFGRNVSLLAGRSITINSGSTITAGSDFLAVVDNFNALRPSFSTEAFFNNYGSIRAGRASIFAVSPDQVILGDITGLNGERFNIWFGDANSIFGANYKLRSTSLPQNPNFEDNPDDRFRRGVLLTNGAYTVSYEGAPAANGGTLHLSTFTEAPDSLVVPIPSSVPNP